MSRDDPAHYGYDGKFKNPRLHRPHFVYVLWLIDGREIVKVGYAIDPKVRLRAIQCGSHLEVGLFATVKCDDVWGAKELERAFHRSFATDFIRGEWFSVTAQAAHRWLLKNKKLGNAPKDLAHGK